MGLRNFPPATGTILGINLVAYVALVFMEGDPSPSARLVGNFGGLLPLDWMGDQYWRFLTAGFLHFGLAHLMANMICLIVWGIPLERMLGAWRFLMIYLGAVMLGGLVSVLLHDGPFVGAGASGGTSGLLGALLALTVLKRIRMPLSFFALNIGLNIVIALITPGVDWQAHLGGFLGGMALAALLPFPKWREWM